MAVSPELPVSLTDLNAVFEPERKIRRVRKRIESLHIDREKIVDRVKTFYDNDMQDRGDEMNARLQRYAKYRMWTEGKQWPWENSSDVGLPDLMQHSLRVQDTLHNAVMAIRPAVISKAVNRGNAEKQDTVDTLLDYQYFEEQPGELSLGSIVEAFVNDGVFTCYTPWVKEKREVHDIRVLPEIPDDAAPVDYFRAELESLFPRATLTATAGGWDWMAIGDDDQEHYVRFFTRDDGSVEVDIEHDAVVYDGPKAIPKFVQDVLHPTRCENLQIPSPSNPLGATHVILRDYPTLDEIKRLAESGFYDLTTKEELEKFNTVTGDSSHQEMEAQKDKLQGAAGTVRNTPAGAESHKTLTRLMCFDTFDVDGDGIDEDVIWWMILETKTLLKARFLTQMFPSVPPRRPFAESQFIPVPGRRLGIGLLEMMETLHDVKKQTMDQTIDSGTLSNVPFFFYRATSNMRPETIRLWPGEGYPLSDPRNDVYFPQMGNQGQAFGFNLYALLTQEEERLTNVGELQFGRIPQGKASALRTVSGMQTVLAQGDARPERILRRFFIGFADIFANFHEMNQRFLPKKKQFRVSGYVRPDHDPYREIVELDAISGRFQFRFMANALNTNKAAIQQALSQLMGTYVSEMNIQLGLIDPDGIFRMQFDYGKSLGIDPGRYLKPPSPESVYPDILAEEAINRILIGNEPGGRPAEGAPEHFKKLMAFYHSDEFGLLDAGALDSFRRWVDTINQLMVGDARKASLLSAAQKFRQGQGGPESPSPAGISPTASDIQSPPTVQDNELSQEDLPGAGGGGNADFQS